MPKERNDGVIMNDYASEAYVLDEGTSKHDSSHSLQYILLFFFSVMCYSTIYSIIIGDIVRVCVLLSRRKNNSSGDRLRREYSNSIGSSSINSGSWKNQQGRAVMSREQHAVKTLIRYANTRESGHAAVSARAAIDRRKPKARETLRPVG